MDKLWAHIEQSVKPDENRHRIYNLLYLSNSFQTIENIQEDFDKWSIADLENALEHVNGHLTFEEEHEREDLAFGEMELGFQSDFYEAANQRDGADYIWKKTMPLNKLKKKRFF